MPTSRVHVQYGDGSPASHVRVVLGFSSGNSKPAYTDSRGWALLEHSSTGRATIFVSGANRGSMHCPGTGSVVI